MFHQKDTTEFFPTVAGILSAARGKKNAITIDLVTERAGIPDRRTTEHLLESRLEDFPFVLVAGSRGYYIPTSAEEVNRYLDSLQSRALKLFVRKRAVARRAAAGGFPREGKHFIDPPAPQTDLFDNIQQEPAHATR